MSQMMVCYGTINCGCAHSCWCAFALFVHWTSLPPLHNVDSPAKWSYTNPQHHVTGRNADFQRQVLLWALCADLLGQHVVLLLVLLLLLLPHSMHTL